MEENTPSVKVMQQWHANFFFFFCTFGIGRRDNKFKQS